MEETRAKQDNRRSVKAENASPPKKKTCYSVLDFCAVYCFDLPQFLHPSRKLLLILEPFDCVNPVKVNARSKIITAENLI